MTVAKDVGKGSALVPQPEQTPFERLAEFVRRIVAVPKSEVEKKSREHHRKRRAKTPG